MLNINSVRCGTREVICGRYGKGYQLMLFMMKSCVVFVVFVYFLLSTIVNPMDITMKRVIPMANYKNSLERYTGIKKTHFSRDLQISDYLGPNNPQISRPGDVGNESTEKSVYMDNNHQSTLWVDSPTQSLTRNEGLHADSINTRNTQTGPVKRLPQALIIGVKKSGTRALLEFLRIHPNVRALGPEPHFFDQHYNKGLEWYRQQMPATEEEQITIEKTPSYFVTKEVPKRIYDMNKNIKLIVVVRDPVTRAISDYTQAATKRSDMKPFEKMAFIDNTSRIVDTKWGAVRIGVYAKYLERWLKYFPLGQIHFVNGEKLISDPAGEMSRLQDFLGLKRLVTGKHFYFKESWRFPCLRKHPMSGQPHCLRNNKGRKHPQVDSRVLIRLRDFFKPFNLKFYQLTGINFNWL